MDIFSGLTAASQALDIAKRITDINDGLKNAEMKLQIGELYARLGEVQIALTDAQATIHMQETEIRKLKEISSNRVPVKRFGAFEYGLNEDGSPFAMPFCPNCLQTTGKQISITRGVGSKNFCPACKSAYDARETNQPRT